MPQEPFEEWIDEAASWLAEHVHDNPEIEQALRQGLWRGAWHLSAYQGPSGCEGISLVTAGGSSRACVSSSPGAMTTARST